MSKPPPWLAEALAEAEVADRLALTMDEARWLRARVLAKKTPYHWRVILLWIKSTLALRRRHSKKL